MATSINLIKTGGTYPEDFPQSVDLRELEALSCSTFKEAILEAQKAYIPYYSIAVIESGQEGERFYQVYDTSYFTTFNANQNGQLTDPITGRPIHKVHYFAMKCFKMDMDKDNKEICQPIDLDSDNPSFLPMEELLSSINTKKLPTGVSAKDVGTMLLDGINKNIFFSGKEEDKQQVRKTQYIIANLIKEKTLFPKLKEEERSKEVIQWLWCSSHGSYKGSVNLAKECLANLEYGFISLTKQQIRSWLHAKIYPIPTKKIPQQEERAITEGINLLNSSELKEEIFPTSPSQ